MDEMLAKVKLALRLSSATFDSEINDLIGAALLDMGVAGVDEAELTDPLIIRAVCTFCKMNYDPDNYDRLKMSYDEQKAQMSMNSGYTNFGGDDVQ